PELDATIVANNIARQIEGRVSYRRAIKMAMASTIRMGAEGIKVLIGGRLGGAEMARREMLKEGRTPLHTFRADIDYALAEAHTKVGVLGIKVWICNGEVYGKRDLSPNIGTAATAAGSAKMSGNERGERRGGGDRRERRGGDRRDGRGGDRRDGGRRERTPRQ
ncbi:MAG TPA: 30S ribosomal protein S3, partial [Bacteroidales bacterium]|nr:30S ribosomal protein S3 [Bacteroidales bacterium]